MQEGGKKSIDDFSLQKVGGHLVQYLLQLVSRFLPHLSLRNKRKRKLWMVSENIDTNSLMQNLKSPTKTFTLTYCVKSL